jgi:hypothetical protein
MQDKTQSSFSNQNRRRMWLPATVDALPANSIYIFYEQDNILLTAPEFNPKG